MRTWEYRLLVIGENLAEDAELLDELDAEGWEVVTHAGAALVLRRRVREEGGETEPDSHRREITPDTDDDPLEDLGRTAGDWYEAGAGVGPRRDDFMTALNRWLDTQPPRPWHAAQHADAAMLGRVVALELRVERLAGLEGRLNHLENRLDKTRGWVAEETSWIRRTEQRVEALERPGPLTAADETAKGDAPRANRGPGTCAAAE